VTRQMRGAFVRVRGSDQRNRVNSATGDGELRLFRRESNGWKADFPARSTIPLAGS